MENIDSQIAWIVKQLKPFVLSHYAGKFSIDFKQKSFLQIEVETADIGVAQDAAHILKSFYEQARAGDAITFIRRAENGLLQKRKTVLRVPRDAA